MKKSFIDRFNSKWKRNEAGCHIWMAHTKGAGYGSMRYLGKDQLAHRIIWQELRGPIPAGMSVCHSCDTPGCVNINHLFLGTHADNMQDMARKKRHPYRLAESNVRAKLTNDQVKEIRARKESANALASVYSVSKRTILNVRHGYTYGSVV